MLKNIEFRSVVTPLWGLWLLVPFASVISHTWLPIPPTIVLFGLSLFIALILYSPTLFNPIDSQVVRTSDFTKKIIILPLCFGLYLLFSQYVMGAKLTSFFGTAAAMQYLVLILIFSESLSFKTWSKYITWFIYISAGILVFEAVGRYALSFYHDYYTGENQNLWIYKYKYYSPIYSESNGAGIHIIVILFFSYWWSMVSKNKLLAVKLILWAVLLLSLSRACVLAGLLGAVYYFFLANRNKKFWIVSISIATLGLFICFYYIIYPLIRTDLSFLSKFEIFQAAILFFQRATWSQWLFGVGLMGSVEYLGIFAHNYFLVYLVETGVIGLGLILGVFYLFVKYTKGKGLILLVPFLLATASSTNLFLPHFFVAMAIMIRYYHPSVKELSSLE